MHSSCLGSISDISNSLGLNAELSEVIFLLFVFHSAAISVSFAAGSAAGEPEPAAAASGCCTVLGVLEGAFAVVLAALYSFCFSAFLVAFSYATADVKNEFGWLPTFSATPFLYVLSKSRKQATWCKLASFLSRITRSSEREIPYEFSS